MTACIAKGTYLLTPKTAYAFGDTPGADISAGQGIFRGRSAPFGADIAYRLTSGSPKDSVKIVVTDLKGDTLKTLTGKGGPGMHHVTWDMKAKPPKPTPLTPAGRRDSLVTARKLDHVFDSLSKANVAPKPVLDRIREHFERRDRWRALSAGLGRWWWRRWWWKVRGASGRKPAAEASSRGGGQREKGGCGSSGRE